MPPIRIELGTAGTIFLLIAIFLAGLTVGAIFY